MQRDFGWRDWVALIFVVGCFLVLLLEVITGLWVVGALAFALGVVGVLFAAWSERKKAGDG